MKIRYRGFEVLATSLALVLGVALISGCSSNEYDTAKKNSETSSTSTSAPTSGSSSNTPFTAGPKTPPCGTYEVEKLESISGEEFPAGQYQINAFGISCDEVMERPGY